MGKQYDVYIRKKGFRMIKDNLSTGILTPARAPVKTSLVVCLPELEHQTLLLSIGPFLGQVTKECTLVLELCSGR